MSKQWGHNKQLVPEQVEAFVLVGVQKLALESGRQDVPQDIRLFKRMANVVLLDDNDQPVRYARAIVQWDD